MPHSYIFNFSCHLFLIYYTIVDIKYITSASFFYFLISVWNVLNHCFSIFTICEVCIWLIGAVVNDADIICSWNANFRIFCGKFWTRTVWGYWIWFKILFSFCYWFFCSWCLSFLIFVIGYVNGDLFELSIPVDDEIYEFYSYPWLI